MKRFARIGLMLAMIVVVMINAAVVASAAPAPKDLPEMEQTVEYRILQESGENASVSIPVMGFIVPLADSSQPDLPPNTGKKDPEKPPKTGDTSNLELFVLLALASLLLMLILVVRRRDDDPENNSLENARG